MSKILANQIANYLDNAPIEIKEGLNIPAGKPLQVDGGSGNPGQVLASNGTGLVWSTPTYFSGAYADLTGLPTIPPAQVNSDWNASTGAARILNKPTIPPQSSVTVGPAQGGGNLTYNNVNGEFTYTPPDLSGFSTFSGVYADLSGKPDLSVYLTSYTETDPVFSASPAGSITTTNKTNWNSAYGWGDHSVAGYLTAEADTLDSVTSRGNSTNNNIAVQDLTVNGDLTVVGSTSQNNVATLNVSANEIIMNDGVTGAPSLNGTLKIDRGTSADTSVRWNETTDRWEFTNDGSTYYNLPIGTNDLTNNAGFLTSYTETDPVFAASSAAGIGASDITNWNTAYGWGNHANGGYLTAESDTLDDVVSRGNTTNLSATFGDLTCTNLTVTGTTTQINTTQLTVSDNLIVLNNDVSVTPTEDAGVEVERGLQSNVRLLWNEGTDRWTFTNDGSSYYPLAITLGDLTNDVGYITSYTETDPVFGASAAAAITTTELSNWNAAYGWGNHATAGYLTSVGNLSTIDDVAISSVQNDQLLRYNSTTQQWVNFTPSYLTSYTETDPVFSSSPAGGITNANITNWNTAFGWGNHSAAGYLTTITSQSLGDLSNVDTSGVNTGDVLKYNGTSWAPATDDTATGGGSTANVPTQDSAPSSPVDGDLWWKSDDGVLKVYYDDGNTTQWVDASPAGSGGGATVTTSDTAPSSPTDGDLWWKSDEGKLKVYYQDTDSSQWVDAAPTQPASNPNVPLYVGELELYNFGTQVQWTGNNGVSVTLRTAEGGGGFQDDYIRVTFPTAFSSVSDYTVQATVYDAGVVGHIYGHAIRRTNPQYFDILIYNLTSSANATQASVAVAVYAI
ncbi:MAG: hypothetical protein CL961_07035 [Euryarchaeota archaeon]|nr:hypothetical protein [Euryarchaeota archaeon]|tara:strand:+ start:820 stop:3360 length:2541 start_codon:yes stop_codon:yes gene_type:complete